MPWLWSWSQSRSDNPSPCYAVLCCDVLCRRGTAFLSSPKSTIPMPNNDSFLK
jgi:hypothetical protein